MNQTLTFAVLAVAAGTAEAQQVGTPQRVNQPVYQAADGQYLTGSAGQYTVDENGYVVENGYAGDPAGYYDDAGQPAAAGLQQVSNLTYQPAPAQPVPAAGDGQPGPNGNAGACGDCCPTAGCQQCCDPFWAHRTGLFAEWLYLKARNDDVTNAQVQNGIGPGAVPFGAAASNSPTYQPSGFRIGGTYALNRCSSLAAAYTYWQGESNGSLFANPPLVVHSLITLPQTGTAASDGTAAFSRYNIRFQFADVDYRRLIAGGNNWFVNYSVGARYANLQQLYSQAQIHGPTQTGVGTNVNMDAAGSRVGLMAARKAACTGFFFYGNAFADILVGNFRASYLQVNSLAGVQGMNTWQSFRPVPILEYELGAGWVSPNGKWRLSGGYYFAAWFNVVTPSTYINAVQTNNFVNNNGVANNITFDGLVTRAQRLW